VTTLHTVNKPSWSSDVLAACLRVAQAGDCVLLIEDGAYNVNTLMDVAVAQGADIGNLQCCVLRDDLTARGFSESTLPPHVTALNHADFVALACAHRQSVHWY